MNWRQAQSQLREHLVTLRHRHGFTQDEVAAALGLERVTYQRIEAGRRRIRASEITRIAKLFELTTKELVA